MVLVMMLAALSVCVSAIPAGCTAVDITQEVKFATAVQMYKDGLPIVRDDAEYVPAVSHRTDNAEYKAPGGGPVNGIRTVIVKEFDATKHMDQLQYDVFWDTAPTETTGRFKYTCVWANNPDTGTSKLIYDFEVAEAGTYELVFVGAAQIKTENKGKPERNRGFCYSVDSGAKFQVNVSETPAASSGDYLMAYSVDDAISDTAGDRKYFQFTYMYNITVELTAGKHTLEYYHLEYAGETITNVNNNSRLNFAGFYFQKALDETALKAYTYPKYVAPETTPAPETTKAPDTTKKPETSKKPETTKAPAPTNAPEVTNAPETKAPASEGGCGSVVGGTVAVISVISIAAVVVRKKKD